MNIEIVDLPIRNGDLPIFPIVMGYFYGIYPLGKYGGFFMGIYP